MVAITDPGSSVLDLTSSFSIEAWVKFNSISQNGYTIEKGTTGTANYYMLYHTSPSRTRCGFKGSGVFRDHDYSWTPTINRWYHFACVFDNTNDNFKIYVDGTAVVDEGETNTPDTDNGSLYLGRSAANNADTINGSVDEVRIWNDVRSEAEIQNNMVGQVDPSSDSTLVGYWRLNENTGAVAHDETTNNNDGSITGALWQSGFVPDGYNEAEGAYTMEMNTPSKAMDFDGGDYVNLGFSVKGLSEHEMALFGGKGKLMRHVRFFFVEDVDEVRIAKLLSLVAEKGASC